MSAKRIAVATALSCLLATSGARAQDSLPSIGGALPSPLPLFPASNWWNLDISGAPVDPSSANFVTFVGGAARRIRADMGGSAGGDPILTYGIPYVRVSGSQPKVAVQFDVPEESDGVDHTTETSISFYPIPEEAKTQTHWIEGGWAGNDPNAEGDRHILIVDVDNKYLYELGNLAWNGTNWVAFSGAFFDMNVNGRRPDTWTSSDAAGLAVLPGLIRYDEVFGSEPIKHALRVTVSASPSFFVYPASHKAGSTAGAPPMGTRFRLKASTDISTFPVHVQRLLQAMKTYGLIVADNGSNMFITGTYDTRWENMGASGDPIVNEINDAFNNISATDFEVVSLGYRAWDMSAGVSDAPDPVAVGGSVVYTATATNLDHATAPGVTLTDTLPGGVTFVSASPGCTESAGVVTCSIGALAAGVTASRTITVTANVSGTLTNTVTVAHNDASFGSQDSVPSNNVATTSTTVQGVTRTVCPSGCTSTRIQSAIDASAANDTVMVQSSYDSLVAGEVFPITTAAIGNAGPITIRGEVDGSGNPTTTVGTRNGPSAGFNIVSPGSVLKDLKILPGDGTSVAKVITASRSGGTCPGATCHLAGLTIQNVVIDFSTSFTATTGIDLRADNVLIDKVTVKGVTGGAILLDGDNSTIQNSTLNGFNAAGTVATGQVGVSFSADQKSVTGAACTGFPTNDTIYANAISGYTQSGIKWCLGRNAIVTSNVIANIQDKAIDTAGSQGSLIQGNAISWTLSGGTHGIGLSTAGLQTCDGNKVIGNRVTGRVSPRDLQRAIVVQSCFNSSVTGNVVEYLAGNESLWVTAPAGLSTHNVVQGNTVQEGNGNGVVYSGADVASTALDTSFVRDNVVLNHGKNGIVVSNMKGPGSVIAYNIVRGNNLELAANQHGFNMSGLSGTVFAANEGLQTFGASAAGFSFASSQNIIGNCNFGGGNAGGLLVQSNVTPLFVNTNHWCRYGLYNHFDFDADGKSDAAIYRNTTGLWGIRPSATPSSPIVVPFGDPAQDDIPAPGNYNSATRTDVAVYRYTTGQWIIRNAGNGGLSVVPFGSPADGDIPVPGKYTQTSLSEVAVFRSSTAHWLIKPAGGGPTIDIAWGCPSCADIPVPFDFDGDGLVDIAVYRRSAGEWYIRRSSNGTLFFMQWGTPVLGDLPVPGNFSTPSQTDVAVYRSLTGEWIIRNSLTGAASVIPFGNPSQGEVPVPADYTVAGTTDIAVYGLLTGQWIIRRSTDFGTTFFAWGLPPAADSPLMAR